MFYILVDPECIPQPVNPSPYGVEKLTDRGDAARSGRGRLTIVSSSCVLTRRTGRTSCGCPSAGVRVLRVPVLRVPGKNCSVLRVRSPSCGCPELSWRVLRVPVLRVPQRLRILWRARNINVRKSLAGPWILGCHEIGR